VLADRRDGQPIDRIAIRAHDGRVLALQDLVWLCPDSLTREPVQEPAAA
jgi:hypothetical protein